MTALEGLVVRRNTTAQQVAEALSERIMNGAFNPGERLRESAIATTLGVARNTVREAVRILELGGLVRYEVNRGAVVISPTPDTVDALFTARERLECAAVTRVATTGELRRLADAYDDLVAAANAHDVRAIVDADVAFHSAIVALLGSERLDEFYSHLTHELNFYLRVLSIEDREYEDPRELLAEHHAILEALQDHEPNRALVEVRRHLETSAHRLKEILTSR